MDEERSPGGSEIKRYEARDGELEPAVGDPDLIQGLTEHVERHLGQEPRVFHEIFSDVVHVDVLHAAPTDEFPFNTLMTCGMSERPMAAPDEFPEGRYAELMLRLPPDWPLEEEAFEDESAYWPIRLLKVLARLPYEYDTWFWYGPHDSEQRSAGALRELAGLRQGGALGGRGPWSPERRPAAPAAVPSLGSPVTRLG